MPPKKPRRVEFATVRISPQPADVIIGDYGWVTTIAKKIKGLQFGRHVPVSFDIGTFLILKGHKTYADDTYILDKDGVHFVRIDTHLRKNRDACCSLPSADASTASRVPTAVTAKPASLPSPKPAASQSPPASREAPRSATPASGRPSETPPPSEKSSFLASLQQPW